MAHARVGSKPREVDLRSCPPCRQMHECRKRLEVGDLQQLSDVALDVRRKIIPEPYICGDAPVVDSGVGTHPDHVEEVGGMLFEAGQLIPSDREEVEDTDPTSQRLAESCGQAKVLRSGQDEPAGRWVFIDQPLEVGEKSRGTLYFVEDRPLTMFSQEPARVIGCVAPHILGLEGDVGVVRKNGSAEGRFS